jgi:hypothetical protein
MLMPVTRMGSNTTLKMTKKITTQSVARSNVTFGLRPNTATRSHELDFGLLAGV